MIFNIDVWALLLMVKGCDSNFEVNFSQILKVAIDETIYH